MIDRLIEAIKKKQNPTVVGLDPTMEMMPEYLKKRYSEKYGNDPKGVAAMFSEFNKNIIDYVSDTVPAVKPQVAMYEKYGTAGIEAYNETCEYAQSKGLIVIGDIKRGDISSTAAAYAAHLGGAEINGEQVTTWHEDAVTLNPYMGSDGIKPFLKCCEQSDKGLFILVKTSNPSSSEIQDLILQDGRTVYEAAAQLVEEWGADLIGRYGYSSVGAVVGATHKAQGEKLRKEYPHMFFLVPGYGAQGAGAEDIAGFFDDNGLGAVINSSRGITQAYKKDSRYKESDYAEAARDAAVNMKNDINRILTGKERI
jgi:orotidine-5'-phosphate decarboxylase